MKKIFWLALLWLTLFSILLTACRGTAETSVKPAISATTAPIASSPKPKLDTLRLGGTIGPMTIPLAYMLENNKLASVASKTTLNLWATPAQLQAMVTGTQADFIAVPSNAAATFYNKGVKLQFVDNSIWNILYIVTADTDIKSMADLKGKKVLVPYQNAVPDAMFQSLCQQQGLDITRDITLVYAPDPIQASQLLLTGNEQYVLLSEPSATSVIMKGTATGMEFVRAINIGAAWHNSVDGRSATPVAGTIVLGDMLNQPEIVRIFMEEYAKAVAWMLTNPVQAGEVGARALVQQGFSAAALTQSLKNTDWRFVKANDARSDLEVFFNTLAKVSPNFIGGKLPDDGFYFKP